MCCNGTPNCPRPRRRTKREKERDDQRPRPSGHARLPRHFFSKKRSGSAARNMRLTREPDNGNTIIPKTIHSPTREKAFTRPDTKMHPCKFVFIYLKMNENNFLILRAAEKYSFSVRNIDQFCLASFIPFFSSYWCKCNQQQQKKR
eukprot:scaffold1640_cov161-Amphora_coffeaeformis.AAC.47